MKTRYLLIHFVLLAVFLLWPTSASAVSGNYADSGGGEYWCNVYVESTTAGHSYKSLTGKDESTAMNDFRGFQSEHNGTISTEHPTIKFKFRYHNSQGGEFEYKGTEQDFYVLTHDGMLHKIGYYQQYSWTLNQTDYTYGVIKAGSHDGTWMEIYFTPNSFGVQQVKAFQIESDTYYHDDNILESDYDIHIHARYLRDLTMNLAKAKEPKLTWASPTKLKIEADNNFLPENIGNGVDNFQYSTVYSIRLISGGIASATKTLTVNGRSSASTEIDVPLRKSFSVQVTRNTLTSFKFNGREVSQSINENVMTKKEYYNETPEIWISFNQVTGELTLHWANPGDAVRAEGDYQIFRTELTQTNDYASNRELIGTTSNSSFIDNQTRGLEYDRNYRYEVFQLKKSWGTINIPSNPEPLTMVNGGDFFTNTKPVIPINLKRDEEDTENIKFDWEFGNVPNTENDLSFKIHRIEPDRSITRNFLEVNVPRTAGKASFIDDKPANICDIYGYVVQLDILNNKIHFYSDTVYAHVLEGTKVTSFEASKGTSGNSVKVDWDAHQVGTDKTTFSIHRRLIGTSDWIKVGQVQGTDDHYSYTDETIEPGRYYEYKVNAYVPDCDNSQLVVNNSMTDTGFGQSSGVVSGRVSFDTGTAVSDVHITLERDGDEINNPQFYSRHILEEGKGLEWHTNATTANNTLRLDKPFTLQMWVNPTPAHSKMGLFGIENYDGNDELNHNAGYNLFLYAHTINEKSGYCVAMEFAGIENWFVNPDTKEPELIPANEFSHITIRNNGNGTMDCIINGNNENPHTLKSSSSAPFDHSDIPADDGVVKVKFFNKANDKRAYEGYVDEVRVWNRALDDSEIHNNYDRLISGRDNGLKLYWTFDEGLEEYAYDYSRTNGYPNGNHAVIGPNSRPSTTVPSSEQLSSYGITNAKGEYEIRGIPFTGSGTRYSVYATKGVHKFSPTSRSAFIGGTSLNVNNVDFTDVSSFKVSGTIRYAGTTIPVDSVSFYVDGMPCNKNDKLIMSDKNGEYEISVPIGSHYIEARRDGHIFVNNGRYPIVEGETYEFTADTHIDFFDSTTVVMAGRITGGNTEGEKPLGYGLSTNTIGAATIKLSALDHPQRMLNAIELQDGVTHQWVPNPEDVPIESIVADINSSAYFAGGNIDDVKYLYITTDAKTGEFSVRVPPLRYMVESVRFPNNPDLEHDELFSRIPAVDITNPRDTIIPDTVYIEKDEYLPLFKCNKKLMLTYRSTPVLEITQQGAPAGAFGEEKLTATDQEKEIELPLYTHNETTREVTYNYGYPVFVQRKQYKFNVLGYEPYTNYDTSPTGKLYRDLLRDSVVSFANELGGDALVSAEDQTVEDHEIKRGQMIKLETGQVKLDEEGKASYTWIAGFPMLTAPYTRTINASTIINGQTRLWRSEGLNAVVSGVLTTGNNFITAGPSHVQMVLRDPPGDASTATWETDTITTQYTYTARGIHQGTEAAVNFGGAVQLDLVTGTLCFAKITYNTIVHENSAWGKYEFTKTLDDRSYTTYTNTHTTATSPLHWQVGRDGDVFIGYSTNYIIGSAEKIGLFKQEDGSWAIGRDEVINMDEKFATHFNYSQIYIETILFDNIKRTRNSMLVHVNSMDEILDNPSKPTYYTFLSESDPKYGSSNDDKEVWGDQAQPDATAAVQPSYYFRYPEEYAGCDSVHWCNEMIRLWQNVLAENEKDKMDAFADPKRYNGNESFETGSTVSRSSGSNKRTQSNMTYNFTTTAGYKGKHGYLLDKAGVTFDVKVGAGLHWTEYDVDETNTVDKFTYTFNDTQRDNAHTVDVYESPKGWSPIFRTRGGQTRCPYEGATYTKYYKKGSQLDMATMRSDNPKISMPVINFDGVPAGQSVPIDVVLTNESETHDPYIAAMIYANPNKNPNGLVIKLDDKTIFNGTEIWLEYGKPLTQTLMVKQSDPSVLDYDNVELAVYSDCAGLDDPQSVMDGLVEIDRVTFSVHFVPAAPDVTLKLNKTVLNQRAEEAEEGIVATISDINRQFTGLKGVRLKYRFAGNDKWITAHEWVTSTEYLEGGRESDTQSLLKNDRPNIVYNLQLPDIDGNYIVAAESMAMFGRDEVVKTTEEQTVIRDTRGPKLLGQAYPNTGTLTPTSDIHIKFNEAIRESYLTKESNFFITGSLNDAQVSHDVSLQFNGNPVETDAYLPISDTSFASTLWLKCKSDGTIIEHGTEGNMLKVAVNAQGQVEATINGTTVTSQQSVPTDKWVFLAMNYVKGSAESNNTFTMLMSVDKIETMLFDEVAVPDYNSTGRLTLGRGFTGMMHELVLWNKNSPVRTLLAQKDEVVAPYLPGLVGYWKMNEGHGTTVTDYARARNIQLPTESWNIENTNLAAHLDGEHTIKIPINNISPRPADSYVVETWFRGEKGKNSHATLLSVTDRMSIGFDYDDSMILHLYNDSLPSYTTNGLPIVLSDVNYNDGNWHHLALNVHRGVSAVAYIDGKAVKTIAEQELPTPAGDYLYVGSILKRNNEQEAPVESFKFTGDIDELRVWNTACDGTSIIANRYNQIDTAQATGLIVYYPMERYKLDANNNIIAEFSINNIAPLAIDYGIGIGTAIADGVTQAATAPSLRKSPLKQNLAFDFTASDKEIYINLNTLPSRMQGNLLTFVVKNVRDMCDNLSETITWSAVVDYNTLQWEEEELSVGKGRLSDYTTSILLKNNGRDNDRFNITGLPSWIQVSQTTGVLGTNESVPIQFTIGANAPVGTHHVYVYAVNDDEICSPLMLHITVYGNEPEWTVNPNDFESSMNIIGQIYIEDKICSNPETMIAAFVDGKCCGVASPTLVTSRDAYFVNMTVYGLQDITKEQPIVFRIYDADQGVVFGNVATVLNGEPLNLVYKPNELVGNFNNPVVWQPTEQIDQLCRFMTGWNWMSLYVKPEQGSNNLESVFGHNKVFNTIKSKEGFAMNSGSQWTSTGLDSVDVGKLYKVKVKSDYDCDIVGTLIDTRTTTQTIYPGWNWIGPLSIYNLSLEEAFADLIPTRDDIVKSKNQVAFYNGYKWEGDLTALIPGMGYYYMSNNDEPVTFHYPTIGMNHIQAPAMVMRAPMELPFTPVDHHQFSDNMNVVARVMVDGVEADNLCVAAFVDDECRGFTTATNDGLYLLTIAGNADETGKNVRFATVYNGETVWFNEELQWQSDWIYGDLDEPQLLHLKISGIDDVTMPSSITISPAVVTDIINVRAGDILKSVKVFSVAGQLLQSFTPDDNQAAYNLSHLTPGVYIVEARTHSGAHAIKQIIKR